MGGHLVSVPILVNMLIEPLRNGESPARTRAKESLVSYGASAVEPLIAVLQTGTSRQIADAIIILGKIGDPRAIEPLIAMLNAPNLLFRMNAAQALGGFNSPVVVEVLLSSL